ncbi:spore germination protein [Bacillus velezensis]|nr:spore germination protein [Bacillus velezensis]
MFSMILSAILGLYGLIMCYLLVIGHLMRLKSFSQDYLIPIMARLGQDLKDTIVRLPTPLLKKRPTRKETKDKIKQR